MKRLKQILAVVAFWLIMGALFWGLVTYPDATGAIIFLVVALGVMIAGSVAIWREVE